MNYKLIAVKLGEQLKLASSVSEINRTAQAVFPFSLKEYQNDAITSQRAKLTYNWVMTLAEQQMPEEGKLDLLKAFIKALSPEIAQSQILEQAGNNPIFEKSAGAAAISTNEIFMLMPFKYPFGMTFDLVIKPVVNSLGYNITKADDNFRIGSVVDQIKDSIKRARLVVADVTGRNPNVFYEIGLAHAFGKVVLIITQNSEDIPFDITHLRYFKYELDNDFERMKNKFLRVFKENLE